jgi:hypothetical protein
MQCGYLIPPQCTTSMHLLAKKFTKLQSVHTFKHTSKKQINWNPCVFVHYVVKENIELCTMSMLNNEHAHNIDSKLTNNLQSVHIFSALKKKKTLKSIYVYAFKKTSELCTILMLSNEHACNACHNPSFGLATKARACKGAGQEWA